jgi:hypothetical protein
MDNNPIWMTDPFGLKAIGGDGGPGGDKKAPTGTFDDPGEIEAVVIQGSKIEGNTTQGTFTNNLISLQLALIEFGENSKEFSSGVFDGFNQASRSAADGLYTFFAEDIWDRRSYFAAVEQLIDVGNSIATNTSRAWDNPGAYAKGEINWLVNASADFYNSVTSLPDQSAYDIGMGLGSAAFHATVTAATAAITGGAATAVFARTATTARSAMAVEATVSTTTLTKFYPANNGFLGSTERIFLMPGEQISRYGSGSGKFFSPAGTPLSMRALPPGSNTGIFNTYKVLKPFEVQAGKIAPAFGQLGLGTQYLSPVSADVLLKRGIIGKK